MPLVDPAFDGFFVGELEFDSVVSDPAVMPLPRLRVGAAKKGVGGPVNDSDVCLAAFLFLLLIVGQPEYEAERDAERHP